MKQSGRSALVLTNQRIDNVQDDSVAEERQGVDFRNSFRQALRVGFKTEDVLRAAHGQAVEVSINPGGMMVEQRGDLNNFGNSVSDQLCEKRFAARADGLLSKLDVTIDEVSEQRGLVKSVGIITGGRAGK